MAAQSTYVMVGNREDLSDMIFDVSPSETPILSAIKKNNASNTLHEWQTDSLASPSATNAAVEGADMGTPADDPTVRLNNQTQILTKDAKVTGSQEGANHAGFKSAMANQIAKKMKEIKTDWEMSAFGANNAKVAGNASTAREMASLQTYLTSNTDFGAVGGADATGDGSDARTDGTQEVFVEEKLTTVLQSCFDNGGDPKLIAVGSFNKGKISSFTGGGTRYVDTDDKKLVNSIDVYVGDFHTLKVVPSRHVRARDALLIDPEYLACSTYRDISAKDIAPTGDAIKKQITWEATLEVCNEAAHGGIFDLTTA